VTAPWTGGRQAGRHAWADENAAGADELAGSRPVSLTSLRFIGSALRRRALLGCAVVLAGLAVTAGLYVTIPPAYQASVSILISNEPATEPNGQMQGNLVLARSVKVAALAVRELRLAEKASSFMRTYSVTAPTDQVLVFTTSATSSAAAVRAAQALADAFMHFRAVVLKDVKQGLALRSLARQIRAAKATITAWTSELRRAPASAVQERKTLTKDIAKESIVLSALGYTRDHYPVVTQLMINGTIIMDKPAPIPPSRKHLAAIYGAAGLFASIAAGLGVVAAGAVTSNRLRRRDDIARTLGAPVRLSVGKIRAIPLRTRLPWRAGGNSHQQRVVAHLRNAVADGGTALAVVAVDNAAAVAPSIASLAVSCASEGRRVVLADLSAGAPAARLLGAGDPGVHEVSAEGAALTVAVPERHDVIPVGPIRPLVPSRQHRQASKALAAACASADLLLSTVTLDSSLGGDHLATWSTDVVVMVTAGRSAAATIHATGEMIKLAGTRLTSAILLGADRNDESLGAVRPSPRWQQPARL
jgi:capsular polysaccharide biosynthesis protein